ncbi:hypothetical protein RB195_011732 [Necator americanus]|uniref:Dual specificity phosphatase, catalytic domain protein n=1 Tax=Necator americanus TaxID=51031 RepID=A0ABR1D3S0_NECAM
MTLQEQIKCAREKLKPTTTVVLLEDGQEAIERRNLDGEFVRDIVDAEVSEPGEVVSNRRRKKVERMRRMGFVVDLQPDLQIARICPGVCLGSQDVAGDLTLLEGEGITHIVNCATGVPNYFPKKFKYLHLEVLDLPWTDIIQSFGEAHEFMKDCVDSGGKVFVHCNAGISRAASFVISYLMVHHAMSLQQAIEVVKSARPKVRPNMVTTYKVQNVRDSFNLWVGEQFH